MAKKQVKVTWGDLDALCDGLASRIRESKAEFDMMIAIARGGFVPARILSDRLSFRTLTSMGMVFYEYDKRHENPVITYFDPACVRGKRVLLVDDVSDSGKSLILAKKSIMDAGAKSVLVATVHIKPGTQFMPDFYAASIDGWIEYPWEPKEAGR
ncbi:MAG: phosphoribosyltransferase [Candidatus Micrarchaeia archaeon]